MLDPHSEAVKCTKEVIYQKTQQKIQDLDELAKNNSIWFEDLLKNLQKQHLPHSSGIQWKEDFELRAKTLPCKKLDSFEFNLSSSSPPTKKLKPDSANEASEREYSNANVIHEEDSRRTTRTRSSRSRKPPTPPPSRRSKRGKDSSIVISEPDISVPCETKELLERVKLMKVVELRAELQSRGLSKSGLKAQLVKRLEEAIRLEAQKKIAESNDPRNSFETTVVSDSEVPNEAKDVSNIDSLDDHEDQEINSSEASKSITDEIPISKMHDTDQHEKLDSDIHPNSNEDDAPITTNSSNELISDTKTSMKKRSEPEVLESRTEDALDSASHANNLNDEANCSVHERVDEGTTPILLNKGDFPLVVTPNEIVAMKDDNLGLEKPLCQSEVTIVPETDDNDGLLPDTTNPKDQDSHELKEKELLDHESEESQLARITLQRITREKDELEKMRQEDEASRIVEVEAARVIKELEEKLELDRLNRLKEEEKRKKAEEKEARKLELQRLKELADERKKRELREKEREAKLEELRLMKERRIEALQRQRELDKQREEEQRVKRECQQKAVVKTDQLVNNVEKPSRASDDPISKTNGKSEQLSNEASGVHKPESGKRISHATFAKLEDSEEKMKDIVIEEANRLRNIARQSAKKRLDESNSQKRFDKLFCNKVQSDTSNTNGALTPTTSSTIGKATSEEKGRPGIDIAMDKMQERLKYERGQTLDMIEKETKTNPLASQLHVMKKDSNELSSISETGYGNTKNKSNNQERDVSFTQPIVSSKSKDEESVQEKTHATSKISSTLSESQSFSKSRKPNNLVSGLHSFASLVDTGSKKKEEISHTAPRPQVNALKLAEKSRLAAEKKAEEKRLRKEAMAKRYEEQKRMQQLEAKKRAASGYSQQEQKLAREKAEREIKLRREKELYEKRQRDAEIAKKRNQRLMEMRAGDEKKRQELLEKDRLLKARMEKMRLEKEAEKKRLEERTKNIGKLNASVPKQNLMNPVDQSISTLDEISTETTNYEMSEGGVSSSDEGTSDSDRNDRGKKIPKWAQKENLCDALSKQFGGELRDPTPSIFPEFISSCNLEEIFSSSDPKRKKRYAKRTSSVNWMPDRPTQRERALYKREMGFQ